MPGMASSSSDNSSLEQELYFLIARFLSAGPCKRAAEALQQELVENRLLPKRTDWEGNEHFRSYENLVEINRHISDDHLLKICQCIGPVIDKDVAPVVHGVRSLLGAGRQSLLRTAEDAKNVKWSGLVSAVNHHGRPLLPPTNLAHIPNQVFIHTAKHFSGVLHKPHACPAKMYSKMTLMTRALGHLSAVYCVSYDRTGKYVFTGADDHLIKIWSAVSGRLLATIRGHSAEITDIAVNYENTLLAAGSIDKFVRVWCLKTLAPVAVLHGHTAMVTSVQFCPLVRGDTHYLLTTGADGCVCFWHWSIARNGKCSFNPKPIKFIERSRAGAQMLCSSFSPGGLFLATGNSDHVIRCYSLIGNVPEKIAEIDAHTDRVDSIQYAYLSDRFVTGSKDGTARIWRYERQEWRAILINVAQKLNNANNNGEDKTKYRVTMVGWSHDDLYVITAVSDYTLKVWNSYTGQLMHVLQGHTDEVFVIENNPIETRLMLSAGHDGHIMLWDLTDGIVVCSWFNNIEGQGHGAVFDCKWSPDGLSFAATDSHGYTMQYGFGSNERFKRLPEEYFFHTDYRPLIRDANNFVLDEQTQQPPHLMPPPFLVDIDGNPHPSHLQRLVPNREHATDNQLVPQIGTTPSGDREVLDHSLADLEAANAAAQAEAAQAAEVAADGDVPIIDALIYQMQREQDRQLEQAVPGAQAAAFRPPQHPAPVAQRRESAPMSPPPHGRGPRRSGETEGVRQASGNVPVSERATERDIAAYRRRIIVQELDPGDARNSMELRRLMAEEEIKKYIFERKHKPKPGSEQESSDSGYGLHTRRNVKKKKGGPRNQASRNEERGRNLLTTRALYDTEEERTLQEETEETTEEEDIDIEDIPEEDSEDGVWHSSSSESASSDYSDWAEDAALNLQPPQRTSARKSKKKKVPTATLR